MTKSQISDFPPSSFYLSQIYNVYLKIYTFESDKSILSNRTQNWCSPVKFSKAAITGNRGYYLEPQQ